MFAKLSKLAQSATFLIAGLAGCMAGFRNIGEPLHTVVDRQGSAQYSTLLVFLPGRGDTASSFIKRGFFSAVRDRRLPVDMIAADAHLGYYKSGVVVERLNVDVIEPALAQGYREIWLVGVSMGALGAMSYAQRYPDRITGIIALAPYLGEAPMIAEIIDAGGPTTWAGGDGRPDDYQRRLWRWLQGYADSSRDMPTLWLAYGRGDRLASGHRLLASVLPSARTRVIDGGHNWRVWTRLWRELLDTPPF